MNRLKDYSNLYALYRNGNRKFKIPFFVFLLLVVLGFASFCISYFPFGISMTMIMMIFPALLFGVLWTIASIRTKMYLKKISPEQLDAIDRELPECPVYEGLAVTSQAVVGAKVGLQLATMENILWVYTSVQTVKLEGVIPVNKSTSLIIAGRNRKQVAFRIKNSQKAFLFIQEELLKHKLDIVFGYERGMDDIYRKDIERLIAFADECAEKRRKNMEG